MSSYTYIQYRLKQAVLNSPTFKMLKDRLSNKKPLDLWWDPPYGFVLFSLGPGYGNIENGLAIFLVLLPDKVLKVVTTNFLKNSDRVESEILFDTMPHGLIHEGILRR